MASDKRCFLKPKPGSKDRVLGSNTDSNVLQPLSKVGKILFPYTPEVTFGVSADYEDYGFTHSVYKYPAYVKSSIDTISVAAKLSSQTGDEAKHTLAVMHFFRSVTKGDFGEKAATPGSPPPIMLFNYMGQYAFNNVPVVIKGCTFSYPDNVTYVEVPGKNTTVPASVTIQFTMDVFYNPDKLRKEFNLDDFAQGKLYSGGYL